MQRLKLEGTPRVKRTKRQVAPPLSPIPATADYTDFGLPAISASQDPDLNYGSLAQSMLNNMFSAAGLPGSMGDPVEESPSLSVGKDNGLRVSSPTSPSPLTGDLNPLSISPSNARMHRVEEEDDLEIRPLSYGLKSLPAIPSMSEEEQDDEEDAQHVARSGSDDDDQEYEVNESGNGSDSDGGDEMDEGEDGDDGDRTINLNDTPRL